MKEVLFFRNSLQQKRTPFEIDVFVSFVVIVFLRIECVAYYISEFYIKQYCIQVYVVKWNCFQKKIWKI